MPRPAGRRPLVLAGGALVAVAVEGDDLATQARLVPLVRAKVARGGKATAYVCEGWLCRSPTTDPEVFLSQIRNPQMAPSNGQPGR
jgi:uncharacterized protein YyaL (SSP411 family)